MISINQERQLLQRDLLKKTVTNSDDIFQCVLRESRETISEPLTGIYWEFLDTGLLLAKWRKASVVL